MSILETKKPEHSARWYRRRNARRLRTVALVLVGLLILVVGYSLGVNWPPRQTLVVENRPTPVIPAVNPAPTPVPVVRVSATEPCSVFEAPQIGKHGHQPDRSYTLSQLAQDGYGNGRLNAYTELAAHTTVNFRDGHQESRINHPTPSNPWLFTAATATYCLPATITVNGKVLKLKFKRLEHRIELAKAKSEVNASVTVPQVQQVAPASHAELSAQTEISVQTTQPVEAIVVDEVQPHLLLASFTPMPMDLLTTRPNPALPRLETTKEVTPERKVASKAAKKKKKKPVVYLIKYAGLPDVRPDIYPAELLYDSDGDPINPRWRVRKTKVITARETDGMIVFIVQLPWIPEEGSNEFLQIDFAGHRTTFPSHAILANGIIVDHKKLAKLPEFQYALLDQYTLRRPSKLRVMAEFAVGFGESLRGGPIGAADYLGRAGVEEVQARNQRKRLAQLLASRSEKAPPTQTARQQ